MHGVRFGVLVNVDTCMYLALRDQKCGLSIADRHDSERRFSILR